MANSNVGMETCCKTGTGTKYQLKGTDPFRTTMMPVTKLLTTRLPKTPNNVFFKYHIIG